MRLKSLSDEPQSVSDEQASLAYDRLVQLYTLLIKAKRESDNNLRGEKNVDLKK